MPSFSNVPILGQPSSVTRSDKADEQDPKKQKGPWSRILLCFTCKTMEQFSDYPPEAPKEYDYVRFEIDRKHGGFEEDPTRRHRRDIIRPETKTWNKKSFRDKIIEQAWSGEKGFKPSFYHTRDTLKEDAAKCFIKHHRPNANVGCLDYRSDSKRIGNPQKEAREEFKREFKRDMAEISRGPRVFLCQYCPYEIVVQQKKQDLHGDDYGN